MPPCRRRPWGSSQPTSTITASCWHRGHAALVVQVGGHPTSEVRAALIPIPIRPVVPEVRAVLVSTQVQAPDLVRGHARPRRPILARRASFLTSCRCSCLHPVRDGWSWGIHRSRRVRTAYPTLDSAQTELRPALLARTMVRIGRDAGQPLTVGRTASRDLALWCPDATGRTLCAIQTGVEGFAWRSGRTFGRTARG